MGCDFAAYPNIRRWLGNIEQLRCWDEVNAIFASIAAGNRAKEFVRLTPFPAR